MLRIEVELMSVAGPTEAPDKPPEKPDATSALLTAITEWWAMHVAQPFAKAPADARLDPIDVPWKLFEQAATFTVRFDHNLLEDLFETYAAFGWDALEEIERRLAKLPARYEPTRRFVRVTRNVVGVLVAQGLIDLEAQLVEYAGAEWAAAIVKLEQYAAAFRDVGFGVENYRLVDKQLAADVLALSRAYGREAAKARRLGAEVERRRRKSPPGTRERGSGWEMWFEVYATPQREAMERMLGLVEQLAARFPAALLVLDDLPDAVLEESGAYRQLLASVELEHRIHDMLSYLLGELQVLREGLRGARAGATLGVRLAPLLATPRDFTAVPDMAWPEGGPEALVMETVFKRTEPTDQRLLASVDLVASLYLDLDDTTRGSWLQVVLFRYMQRLEHVVDAKRKTEAAWEQFWSAIRRLTALLALVALMIFFPFGDAATLPALTTVLTLSASGAAILGVVTLLVYDLLGGLERAGKLELEARDRFFRLSQTDPDAVTEIGELLTRSQAVRDGVGRGLLVTILTLGAAHKLKAVAAALDFEGFASDVETLFAPDER